MATRRTDIGVSWGREDSHGPGDTRFERALAAAHSLSDLLWEELHEQPGSASTPRAAALAERIADLASTVALLAGNRDGGTHAPATRATASAPGTSARSAAVLIDERDELSADQLWAPRTRRSDDRVEDIPRALELPWLGLIERGLADFERDCEPFAVLLVEVLDAVEPIGANGEIGRTIARALDAIRPASIAPEDSRRYWMLVPRADRLEAREVADRLARASGPVEDFAGRADAADTYFAALSARASRPRTRHPATPLRLIAGTAACPESGRDVSTLIAHAHIELAEARAASVPFAEVTEPV